MKYLKEEAYYQDLYDLLTIQECLRVIENWKRILCEQKRKDLPKGLTQAQAASFGLKSELYFIKGENYRRRRSMINEWIERDRRLDEKLDAAQEPKDVHCSNCAALMQSIYKMLYNSDEPLRVLFTFECPSCKKKKGVWEDGQFYVPKPHCCPKCNKEIKISYAEKNHIETWTTRCSFCGFLETEVVDLDKKKVENNKRERQEKALLKKHRAEFCLSEKEGFEYIEGYNRVKRLSELLDRIEQRETNPVYKKAAQLEKLTTVQLERVLSKSLKKEKYVKLSFEKPEISRHFIIPFSVQDADSSRKENDSVRKLRRLIKKTLAGTNWHLMSEGMSYRLGYLWGRLRGADQEDELVEMVKEEE
ncbi:MAG: hypothetical protein H6754_06905 [Candidatus Omnitrophica bacterium]|nr:hypothetical protein [Candidatus Omnitrophota bacterium]